LKTHYEVLGLSSLAEDVVIKAAFKAMAQKYHPDKNKNKEHCNELMTKLNAAYKVLSDPKLREKYDESVNRSLALKRSKQQQTTSSHYKSPSRGKNHVTLKDQIKKMTLMKLI